MRPHGSSITDSSGKTSLIHLRNTLKNRKKRRIHNGKLRQRPGNKTRSPKNVRGPARESLRSLDATGKAREMDVPLSGERNALYGGRRVSGRNKHDGGHYWGRRYFQPAGNVSGDSATGKAGVHMELGEIFRVGAKDRGAG